MAHVGRLEQLGVAIETTRGTALDPTLWLQVVESDFDDVVEKTLDESAVGVTVNSNGSTTTKKYSSGSVTLMLGTKSIPFFFYSLFGAISSAETVGTGAYAHTFSLSASNSKPSLTLSKKTPLSSMRYPLSVVGELIISATAGSDVRAKMAVQGKEGENDTLAPIYSIENKFFSKNIEIKIADTVDGLSSATAFCCESIELTLTQELEPSFCFSSGTGISDLFSKTLDGKISFTKVMENETYKGYVAGDNYKAMSIKIIDSVTTIGVSDHPTVSFTIARGAFEDHVQSGGLNDIVRETLTCKIHQDIANGRNITAQVINTTASYIS